MYSTCLKSARMRACKTVEAHRGQISVDTKLGEGTQFSILLSKIQSNPSAISMDKQTNQYSTVR